MDEVIESSSRAIENTTDAHIGYEDDPQDALYDVRQEDYSIIEIDNHLSVEDSDEDDRGAGSPFHPDEAELLSMLRQLQQHTDQYNDIDDEDILRSPRINSSTLSGSRWGDDVDEFNFVESML
jgi:hypothetical protein